MENKVGGQTGWKALGLRPAILPVIGICVLVTSLVFLFALKPPQFDGQLITEGDRALYITPAGERWEAPVITGSPNCPQAALLLTKSDLVLDFYIHDPDRTAIQTVRQRLLACLVTPGATISGLAGETIKTEPMNVRARQMGDLSVGFWGSVFVAIVAALVSGWVWSLKPRETATRLFLINGLSFMICYDFMAIFKAHGLGYDPRLFETFYLLNEFCNHVFFLSLLALFAQYPVRLLRGWRVWSLLAVGLLYVTLVLLFPQHTYAFSLWFTVVLLLATLGLIGWQWWATRRQPGDRAALMWLALSVLVGASLWAVLLLVTEHLNMPGLMSEIVIILLFFPFYLGLAMGVARFCLVELQDWSFRILFFAMAAILFATVDVALVTAAGMAGGTALAIALFAIAFLYLPLRDLLWRRFVKRRSMSRPDMFAAVMEIAFAPTPGQRRLRWEVLVKRLFEPLNVEAVEGVTEPRIGDNGLTLVLPPVADAPALNLQYARQGRELFSPTQLALVQQLIALVRTAANSRDAYERGAAEERRRMAQDLHDDVGARLLSGLHLADDRTKPVLQGALSDIRAIAGGMLGREAPLDQVMADIRHEGVRRLESAGITVAWQIWSDEVPLILVDYRFQKSLASALREIVSNIIRHSEAKHVTVDFALSEDQMICTIRDDGCGLPDAVLTGEEGGQGLKGLSRRMTEVGGRVRFSNRAEGGVEILLHLPLASGSA